MKKITSIFVHFLLIAGFSITVTAQHGHNHSSEKTKTVESQKELTCPVTKSKIKKGKEITFVFKNKEFKVCCDGCIDEIKKNFSKYEKFGKKVKK